MKPFKSILIVLLFIHSLGEAFRSFKEGEDVSPTGPYHVKRPTGTFTENDRLLSPHNGNISPSLAENANDKIYRFSEEKALERLLSEFTLKRSSKPGEKRNIAHLARKGWLTTLRSYRPSRPPSQNRYSSRFSRYNWKRELLPSGDEPANFNENGSSFKNDVALNDEECVETGEALESDFLAKKNINVLARSGKLPRLHSSTNWLELKTDNNAVPVLIIPNGQLPIKHQSRDGQDEIKKCKTVR
ncbi:uncharacterized protein LOC143224230 [Tachypleus tridentatus]|uniref:uncharacterized protein LOC143224230 n=1 Tax=Tachypleus tridentatus TaxID=6853 RepID=UPI003FD0917D